MMILVLEPVDDNGLAWLHRHDYRVIRAFDGARWDALSDEVEALIVRSAPVDAALLERLPNLRVVGKHGVGVENIDFAALAHRDIPVTFTPGAATNAVAEHGVALLFAAARQAIVCDSAVRAGNFDRRHRIRLKELTGAKLGLVGCGRIGTRVARICTAGLGMAVGIVDPYVAGDTMRQLGGRRFASVTGLCRWADHVVVTAPLTGETRGLIGTDELNALGSDGVVVAVGRGGIVDESALADAVSGGRIWAAALDVFSDEPPASDNPVLACERVVLSPHVAGVTDAAMQAMSQEVCKNVVALLEGGTAPLVGEDSMPLDPG